MTTTPAAIPPQSSTPTNASPSTLGILGGGQLARMLVHAAQRMGYGTVVLDPTPASPAGQASHSQIEAAYSDPNGWQRLLDASDAITTEFENVPAAALQFLAQSKPVSPPASAVAAAQDRLLEKQHFTQCGVRCAPYHAISTLQDVQSAPPALFPAILKTARLGYDGKGQAQVATLPALEQAWRDMGSVPSVLEQRLPLALECSVIVARNAQGQIVHFAPQRNVHHDGILSTTYAFAGAVPPALADDLVQATARIAQGLQYVGVLCVEYFVLQDGGWVVNEMAPRPHNSGHYTIDACEHSQFDLQVRTTMQLPLPQPRQHSAAIMLNILGDIWFDASGQTRTPPWQAVQHLSGVHLHLYGKQGVQRKRKMGHITITAASAQAAQQRAAEVAQALGLPFEPLPV